MFPPGLEPGTFRVLGERDNHYTTETCILELSANQYCHLVIFLLTISPWQDLLLDKIRNVSRIQVSVV